MPVKENSDFAKVQVEDIESDVRICASKYHNRPIRINVFFL